MKRHSTYQWLRGTASLLLLLGYFLNVVPFESFHQAVHQHEHAEIHTQEAEADACHRAIYHGETSHHCEHKSHITETETDCDLCKVTVSRFHFVSNSTKAQNKPFECKAYKVACRGSFGSDNSLTFPPRGPPAFS